jgi:hypothetical protein
MQLGVSPWTIIPARRGSPGVTGKRAGYGWYQCQKKRTPDEFRPVLWHIQDQSVWQVLARLNCLTEGGVELDRSRCRISADRRLPPPIATASGVKPGKTIATYIISTL